MRNILVLAAFSFLFAVIHAQSPTTPAQPTPPRTLLVVSYAHAVGTVLYHGTISYTDGVVRATWSFERDGKKVTEDGKVGDEDFETLWHAISDHDHFNKFATTDANSKIDPVATHLVGIAFQNEGETGLRMFAVPVSAEKEEWFSK